MQEVNSTIDQKVNEAMSKGANGINENSLLMYSINEDRTLGERTLKNFTNNFTQGEFQKYFEYNSAGGELICKQDGWFSIYMNIAIGHTSYDWSTLAAYLNVNGKEINNMIAQAGAESTSIHDTNTINVYLKKNDRISISKKTIGVEITSYNTVIVRIFKI